MKYKINAIIELKRHHCIDCPICNSDDMCILQPGLEDEEELMWEDMLSRCPLEPIREEI